MLQSPSLEFCATIAVMPNPVLQTKLVVPYSRAYRVPRPRLVESLNRGLELGHRLLLVSAPPGYGKTTLLGEWANQGKYRFGWLTLDEGDNDPSQFWNYAANALAAHIPNLAGAIQTLLESDPLHQLPSDILTTTLLNTLAQETSPLVLVLDDYHVIQNERIHATLIQWLAQMPAHFHLAVTSRNEPPLELPRLRARGQVTEIHMDTLGFSADESSEYLNTAMKLGLTAEETSLLADRAEGWIAGLQLAALALQSIQQKDKSESASFIREFGGGHRFVSDYLTDEVLKRQSDSIQNFLFQTSLLEKLTAPLCDHVLQRDDSQGVLEFLERTNLFLIPLDDTRQWYRHHPLWAEMLQARLKREHPEPIKELHRRAFDWFADNGFQEEAISHAIAAGEADQAAGQIEAVSRNLVKRGGSATLQGWLAKLPRESIMARPALVVAQCWALITDGRLDEVECLLDEMDSPELPFALVGEIAAIRAILATVRQDLPAIHRYTEEALRLIPFEDSSIRCGVLLSQGTAAALSGQIERSIELLTQTIHESQRGRQPIIHLIAVSTLAQTFEAIGDFDQAERLHRQVIALESDSALGGLPLIGVGFVGLGGVLHERLLFDEAESALQKGLEIGRRWGSPEIQIGAYLSLARLRFTQGRLDEAQSLLETLMSEFASAMPIHESGLLRSIAARFSLAQGQLSRAETWAKEFAPSDSFPDVFENEISWLVFARILLSRREFERAADLLAKLEESARAGHRTSLIEILLLKLKLPTLDARAKDSVLAEALRLGEPQNQRRIFLDEDLLPFLKAYRAKHSDDSFAATLADNFERRAASSQGLLSEREMDVLRLLAAGHSNQEIADRLVVALSTVKSHVKNILMKLEAENRTGAVARARELKLI